MAATKTLTTTDTFVLADGRSGKIESGSAFHHYFEFSGFDGYGYVVTVDGAKVAQTAFRFDAIRAARELGANPIESLAMTAWEMEQTEPRPNQPLGSGRRFS